MPAFFDHQNEIFSYDGVVEREASRRMENQFFKSIEEKTGVNMKEIVDLANSLQNANFRDERTVRGIIKRVSKIANKSVPKELEDKMVHSIIADGKKLDFSTISDMLNKTKYR